MFSDAPCAPWLDATDEADQAFFCCDVASYDPDLVVVATEAATMVLWALSGRRYGPCALTVRPCKPAGLGDSTGLGHGMRAGTINGQWVNVCGHPSGGCGCTSVPEVVLPGPVQEITSVKVDGVELDPTAYRVDDHRRLVRLDGDQWPACQNLLATEDEVGSFVVAFTYGMVPDAMGRLATGELACEILKSCVDDESCRLPQRVTSISRQGVDMTLLDPQAFLADGKVGLYYCDLWLSAVNPNGLRSPARIYSPDRRPPRVVS